MDIICDTNIWYALGNGFIKEDEVNNKVLAMHWLSLCELLTTNKNFTNREFLKNALESVLREKSRFYQYPPMEHIAHLADPNYTYEPNQS